jgi:hypothetical protein
MAKNESGGRKGGVPAKVSSPAPGDSGPPGDGSPGVWTDSFGRLCIGNECFHAAMDVERKEVRVIIDESGPCGSASQDDIQAVVTTLKEMAGQGADTVYQTKSTRA